MRAGFLDDALDALRRGRDGATRAFGEGREDHREALKRARGDRGLESEGTRIGQMLGTNRTVTLGRELMGKQGSNPGVGSQLFQADPTDVARRNEMGLGIPEDKAEKIGYILGTLGADLVQDRGRGLWWLLNAPQAAAAVVQEIGLKKAAPGLFKADLVNDAKGNPVTSKKSAYQMGIANKDGDPVKGYFRGPKGYQKRRHDPGHVDLLQIPAGIAINSGIGLLNPFGGQEGYKAVFESDEDPSKTSNVLGEIAAKYVLGRTGNLLNWDDFRKVRPDVSKDEYMRYKAFKFDNETDLNPLDGDVVLPTGVLKYTNEGIHGPEIQFLGRSLPIATGILPTAGAIAGTTYGARRGGVRGGLIGGLSSLAASTIAGNVIEQERRKRNKAENERDQLGTISM